MKKKPWEERRKALRKSVQQHGNKFWRVSQNWVSEDSKSWFSVERTTKSENLSRPRFTPSAVKPSGQAHQVKCRFVTLLPSEKQRQGLMKLLHGHRMMYNATIKWFRREKFLKKKPCLSAVTLKKVLANEKKEVQNKTGAPAHVLTEAIKEACSNFKAALTNCKLGNIKRFCLRYIGPNKKTAIAKLDCDSYRSAFNTLLPRTLGKERLQTKEGFEISDLKTLRKPGSEECPTGGPTCTLHFNKETKVFRLYIPEYVVIPKKRTQNNYVGVDPGIRTFLTCYGKNDAVKIGSNYSRKVGYYVTKMQNAKRNKSLGKKLKRKISRKCERKISGLVEELHWKSINLLTSNYDRIVIGSWSTKSCVRRNGSVLAKKTKVLSLRTCFFKFLSRLQYKCILRRIGLKITEESYTSCMCSACGVVKRDLGSAKTFCCNSCENVFDRDINGAKNILLKAVC